MGMATVQFFRNNYAYPDFMATLTPETGEIECTPKGMSTRAGTLHLSGNWGELARYNYIRLRRDGHGLWAWITNLTQRTDDSALIEYQTDPWRTWEGNIRLSQQFIQRQPEETELFDELLAGYDQANVQDVIEHTWSTSDKRVLVVQARAEPAYVVNNTPVQVTPYHYYMIEYDINNWQGEAPIVDLMNELRGNNAQATNIVTIYSIPYMNIAGLSDVRLPVLAGDDELALIEGFKFLGGEHDVKNRLVRFQPLALNKNTFELMQVEHDVKVLIPGAGTLNVTDEAIKKGNLKIRQDVDMFSGASNFMLTCGQNNDPTGQSVRGSSVSSIPILSDPYDTYLSQNQNSLTTAMIGDVATLAGGGVMMATGNPAGALGMMSGVNGLVRTQSQKADMKNSVPSNPPAMLGTALANHYNNKLYVIVTYNGVDNRATVHQSFGYPVKMVKTLVLPSAGFIQTQNCAVASDGTVPRWALEEVNQMFDSGLRVRTS